MIDGLFVETFEPILKLLKPSVNEEFIYVYCINSSAYIYSVSSFSIRYTIVPVDINIIKYDGCAISIEAIKNPENAIYMKQFAVLPSNDEVLIFRTRHIREYNMNMFYTKVLLGNIESSATVMYTNINEKGTAFNDMMSIKSSEGAKVYNFDITHSIIISPNMLPATKSSNIDVFILDYKDHFDCLFKISKNKNTVVYSLMSFLFI